jgi:hypothetical protein
MGMGKSIKNFLKKQEKEKEKDLENRANQFIEEYKVLRSRYRCDFQSFIMMKNGGEGGITPSIRIIDISEQIITGHHRIK